MSHSRFLAAFLCAGALSLMATPPGQLIGRLRVITLQDTELSLPSSLLKGIEPAEAKRMLGGKDAAPTPVNAFLIRTPDCLVLVDTGTGPQGKLMQNLKAAGVDPAQVDLVLITHFHFDHVGGLVKADGTRAFPKALVRVSRAEHDFWLGEPSKLPERLKAGVPAIKAALAPYQVAGTYKPFAPGESLGKDIRALPAYGHTSGHTAYIFSSEGKELWCIGDLIHFGAVQFERPGVAVTFDTDSEQAVSARKDIFRQAAQSKAVLAGAHLAFPGLFQLQVRGDGFAATALSAEKP
jgi:glyoxylase-like metal-dependent hydrolase (beta-lactamase superfamily II)